MLLQTLCGRSRDGKNRPLPLPWPTKPGRSSCSRQRLARQYPPGVSDRTELRKAVQAAIESLGERQRMAVMLTKFEHLGYAEVGEVMEMKPQAVKSLLARARENLRVALAPYLERGDAVAGLVSTSALETRAATPGSREATGGGR